MHSLLKLQIPYLFQNTNNFILSNITQIHFTYDSSRYSDVLENNIHKHTRNFFLYINGKIRLISRLRTLPLYYYEYKNHLHKWNVIEFMIFIVFVRRNYLVKTK